MIITTTTVRNQEEAQILLESLTMDRIRIKSFRKKNLKGNQIKYTLIVEDIAIPETGSPIKKRKNNNDKKTEVKPVKEQPKEKVVIQKKEKTPIPPPRPDMAEIVHI